MKEFQWDPNFNIGIKEIDEQHQSLIILVNKLKANKENHNANNIVDLIKEVINYTKQHFSDEENHMAANNYDGLENHKKLHREFVNEIKRLLSESNQIDFTSELYFTLVNWIIEHIKKEDYQYGQFLKTKKD